MRRRKPAAPRDSANGFDFGPFRLTPAPLRLRRGRREVKLQPRPLAVLLYLVEHAGVVVSQEELLRTVWNGTVVTLSALQVCVRAVRTVLGDEVQAPRYIETVGREGYRFIGQVVSSQYPVGSRQQEERQKAKAAFLSPAPNTQHLAPNLVGRDAALTQLHTLLGKALTGERQLVFVTGEAGIGKTTLVDAFLGGIRMWELGVSPVPPPLLNPKAQFPDPTLWIGRGQCLEHYGEGEAYLPVLEAVGQLCQGLTGSEVLATLRRYAPTWLLHLPGVVDPAERETLARQGAGTTQGQMLREIAEALEAISVAHGLVLVLEDLHVSDPSTVELLAYLAQRRAPARLFIIGTYRPVEVVVQDHPLRGRVQELLARGYGQAIALELLTETEVKTYLHRRLGSLALPATLAGQIWRRTDGNPLFVASMVEYLLQQRWLTASEEEWQLAGDLASSGVPKTLQHLIAKQLDSLSSEQQRVLEVASAVGATFATASVAAGVPANPVAVGEVCEELARRGQFIREQGLGTWPDGTISEQYAFRHALYQEVLYQRLGTGRRARVHLAIGICEEQGYGARAGERAAELAQHFVQGRDLPRAVGYLVRAGQNALRWSAYVEAVRHFSQGLTLLAGQPESPERKKQELWLQTGLVMAQTASKGFPIPEVEHALLRAHTLCSQIGDTPDIIPVLAGLWNFYLVRGEIREARPLADQTFRLAQNAGDPALLGVAQANLQATLYSQGELAAAHTHGQHALAQFAASPPLPLAFSYGVDLEARTRSYANAILHALGYLDQARQQNQTALVLAQKLGHVQTIAATLHTIAGLHGGCREWREMQARAAELMELATAQGLLFWWAQGACNHGIALAQQGNTEEGISQIRQGLAVYRATGAALGIARILGWLAEVCGQAGQIQEGLQVLDEAFALVERNEERIWEAELYRRKGELLLTQEIKNQKSENPNLQSAFPNLQSEAEACFLKAIDIARRQQAKLWELRAVLSLSRLWQQQGKSAKARQMLAEIYGWFTEGFDTADLQEAKIFLEK